MQKYTQIKKIGSGSFGAAILCKNNTTNEKVVIKKIDIRALSDDERRAAKREANILSALHHPSIIHHVESFEEDGFLCIVTEFAERGDLNARIEERKGQLLPEAQVLDWFIQIAMAMLYIHKKKILHRDLKLQNVFLNAKNIVKLGDFGIARVLKHTMECAKTVVGTPYYLSPEICENRPYNHKSDVWSAGCILYELCAQKHAFEANSITALMRKILKGTIEDLPQGYSRELRYLVNAMLQQKAQVRPAFLTILQQPFLFPYIQSYISRMTESGQNVPYGEQLLQLLKQQQSGSPSAGPSTGGSSTGPVSGVSSRERASRSEDETPAVERANVNVVVSSGRGIAANAKLAAAEAAAAAGAGSGPSSARSRDSHLGNAGRVARVHLAPAVVASNVSDYSHHHGAGSGREGVPLSRVSRPNFRNDTSAHVEQVSSRSVAHSIDSRENLLLDGFVSSRGADDTQALASVPQRLGVPDQASAVQGVNVIGGIVVPSSVHEIGDHRADRHSAKKRSTTTGDYNADSGRQQVRELEIVAATAGTANHVSVVSSVALVSEQQQNYTPITLPTPASSASSYYASGASKVPSPAQGYNRGSGGRIEKEYVPRNGVTSVSNANFAHNTHLGRYDALVSDRVTDPAAQNAAPRRSGGPIFVLPLAAMNGVHSTPPSPTPSISSASGVSDSSRRQYRSSVLTDPLFQIPTVVPRVPPQPRDGSATSAPQSVPASVPASMPEGADSGAEAGGAPVLSARARVLAAANQSSRGAVKGMATPRDEEERLLLLEADRLLPHGLPLQAYRAEGDAHKAEFQKTFSIRAHSEGSRRDLARVEDEVGGKASGVRRPLPRDKHPATVADSTESNVPAASEQKAFIRSKREAKESEDSEDDDRTDKFTLNGKTLKLNSARSKDPLSYRVECLREYLSTLMGEQDFIRVYRRIVEARGGSFSKPLPRGGAGAGAGVAGKEGRAEDLSKTVKKALGDEGKGLVPLVFQLIRCEEKVYSC